LTVHDGTESSEPDLVEIHTNGPPIANAGPDQIVSPATTVQLDGSGSSDPEGVDLTYHWILNVRPPGSVAQLSSATLANPTFVADRSGTYVAQLVVSDGFVNSASDTVSISTANQLPIANAGPDQTGIPINTTVQLEGSGSMDPDGAPVVGYTWTFVSRPPTSSAILLNATTATPTFVADRAGRYRVQLVVRDALADSAPDVVDVTTVNAGPTANAGADQRAIENTLVTLNGSGSSDPDENPLTYAWTLLSAPTNSTAALTGADTVNPTLTPDLPGLYTVRLVVNDGFVDSPADTVEITAFSSVISMALVDTPLVGLNRSATLRVILPFEAPMGGVTVDVASDNADVVGVASPGTVTILEGQTTGDIVVRGLEVGTTVLRAAASGYGDGAFEVTVTQNVLTVPANLTVALGQNTSLPVTIPAPAPAGGISVNVVSGNPTAVEVLTPTVLIPAGSVGANATVRGASPGASVVAASSNGFSSASALVASQANLNITVASVQIRPEFPANITVRLESAGNQVAAPAGGIEVTFASSDAQCAAAAAVTIPAGLTSASAQVTYGGVSTPPCAATLTALAAGITSDTVSVTVNPNPAITLQAPVATLGAGLQDGFHEARLGEGNHGGVTVTIRSSNPERVLVSRNSTTPGAASIQIDVDNGLTSAYYYVQAVESARGASTITATADRFVDGEGTVTVVQPGLQIFGLTTNTTTLSPDNVMFVYVGVPSATGELQLYQSARAGGGGFPVTVTHTNAAVARLTTSTGSAQTRSVVIPPGQPYTQGSVATGGVAFDPLTPGTTTVSASSADARASIGVLVTVVAPGITFHTLPTTIGAGLQDGWYFARLAGSNHNGAIITIASDDPGRVQLAPSSTAAPAGSINIELTDGVTDAYFYIHAIENARGAVRITATEPRFNPAEGSVNVVEPGLQLFGLPQTTTTVSANPAFYAYVGIPNTNGDLSVFQTLRSHGPGLPITVTNTNATVAQLITSAGAGQVRTVTVAPGFQHSPTSIATGGILFDALAAGGTTVSGTAAGFRSANAVPVTVTGPGMTMSWTTSTIGAGLQDGWYFVRLGGSDHGGATVTIRAIDPRLAQVSPDSTTPGADSIDIVLQNGTTEAYFYVQGVEGASGTTAIRATSTAFGSAEANVTIVQPGLQVFGLPADMTSLSANVAFYAYVGIPNEAGDLMVFQSLRAREGDPGLSVSVTHTNTDVAQLRTSTGVGQTRTVLIASEMQHSPTSVSTGGVEFDPIGGGSTIVSVTAAGFRPSNGFRVTVSAPGISLTAAATVGAGLQDGWYVARLGGANHGRVAVTLRSSNGNVLRLSPNSETPGEPSIDIIVENGQVEAYYWIQGMEGARGTAVITASAPGFTDAQGSVNVAQPGVQLFGAPPVTTTLSASSPLYAYVGLPNGTASGLVHYQSARAGGAGVQVTLSLLPPTTTAAQLTNLAGSGATRTVTIAPGHQHSPTTLADGGVLFDPLTVGNVTVATTATGFENQGLVSVSVTAAGIDVTPLATVGAGLQEGYHVARLGGTAHGGAIVRVASANPDVLLVSSGPEDAGRAFVDIPVTDGFSDAYYFVHGVRQSNNSVTITASEPRFVTGQGSVRVVEPAIQIELLPTTISSTAASVPFRVAVGLADSNDQFLVQYQGVRAGTNLTATLTNSAPSVAQLVTAAGGAQSRAVVVPGGSAHSGYTIPANGVDFDPLDEGPTIVTAAIPGFVTAATGIVHVDVTGGTPATRRHVGATDPLTEGFGGGQIGTPVSNDGGTGLDAWRIASANGGGDYYASALTAGEMQAALTRGWKLTARMRLESGAGYAVVDFQGAGPRFQIALIKDANGDTVVRLPTSGDPFVGLDYTLVGSQSTYHLYELVYDPSRQRADLYVDGIRRISDYAGFSWFPIGSVYFGASRFANANGVAYHNLARFEIFD
jgi:hypothetical protein